MVFRGMRYRRLNAEKRSNKKSGKATLTTVFILKEQ